MNSPQGHCLCYRHSKVYHQLCPSIHFLHHLAVPIDFGNALIILGSWTGPPSLALQKQYPVVPKNPTGNHTGRDRLRNNTTTVCRSFPAHRFRQNSCSKLRPNMNSGLCSRWALLGRRTIVVSYSQHKTLHIVLLIQFCYGSCNPETGRSGDHQQTNPLGSSARARSTGPWGRF